jgi:hypothetical protein
VHPDWHNFQNFAEWYVSQPNAYKEGFDLDKDIILRGNKEYSAHACDIIPFEVNKVIRGMAKKSTDLPTGVRKDVRRTKMYSASCRSVEGISKYLGCFCTKEEAFAAYKLYKEDIIKVVAEKNKSLLKPETYNSLMNWEIK